MSKTSVLPTLPCRLPTVAIDQNVNANELAAAFESRILNPTASDFKEDAIWRDLFALTGTLRTFYGALAIQSTWKELAKSKVIENVKLIEDSPQVVQVPNQFSWIQAAYTFETTSRPAATCRMMLWIVPTHEEKWEIWQLRTILIQLIDQPNVDYLETIASNKCTNGISNGISNDTHHNQIPFDAVVVGGGPAGLSVAGRLKALGLKYVLLDKNENVGDNWKLRYDSVKLHTIRDTAQLPFDRIFLPSEYGKYLNKDDLAMGYARWAHKYGINIWLRTTLEAGQWQEREQQWRLTIRRESRTDTVMAAHVVIATGPGAQIPKMPHYPNSEAFGGTIMHSAHYTSAAKWTGKDCVVIGTANTGHDVAEDMVNAGCSSVTMVQRSPTYVFAASSYEPVQEMTYRDDKAMEECDLQYLTSPLAVSRLMANLTLHAKARMNPEPYDALERAGFKLIRYGDIIHQLYECFGGHYMDVGAMAKISSGAIKIKSDALPVGYGPRVLVFSDGSELAADAVVFATGFEGNMKADIKSMFGCDIAEQIDDFWGLDSEGELRGAFKPTGNSRLWMAGGTLGQVRFYSRFVALQICADIAGQPLAIYRR